MPFAKELMKGLSETIVLKILADQGEVYGYQLTRAIREDSHGSFDFAEGTIYPLLYRLEVKGFVVSTEKEAPSGKNRRYYRLTSKGKSALKTQSAELTTLQKGLNHLFSTAV